MKTIASLGLVVLLLLGLNYWQYSQGQALLTRAVDAEQTSKQNETVITELRAQSIAQSEALLRLATQQNTLSQYLTTRQQKIKELEREDENYRNWANTRLPDAAQRLRQRPAINGAADYQRYLSTADTLHPASDEPDPERRSDN